MDNFLQNIFRIRYTYSNPLERERARLLITAGMLFGVLGVLATAVLMLSDVFSGQASGAVELIGLVGPVIGVIIYGLVQRGYLQVASILLVGTSLLLSSPMVLNGIDDMASSIILTPLIIAGLVLSWRGILGGGFVLLILLIQGSLSTDLTLYSSINDFAINFTIVIITLVTITVMLLLISNRFEQLNRRYLSDLQGIRTANALIMSADIDDEQTLITRTIRTLREQMAYTVGQVYLVEDDGSIGDRIFVGLGVEQVDTTHNIQAEGSSGIAEALRSRQPVIVSLASSPVRRAHFQSDSLTGIALPLIHQERVLGVLDVQSNQAVRISQSEQETLETVARQLSMSLVRLRTERMLHETIREYEQVINRQRDRLHLLEQSQRSTVSTTWGNYLSGRGKAIIGYDIHKRRQAQPADHLPDTLDQVIQAGQPVIEANEDKQTVSIPITLRGQILGGISFEIGSKRTLNNRQIDTIQNVMQRLALALENKRLFEQSQSQAQRESKASEIGNLLLTSTEIETIMARAAREFNAAVGAVQTQIHLDPTMLDRIVTRETDKTEQV